MRKLVVQVELYNHLKTFHIRNYLTSHNSILDWIWLHKMIVVPSIYNQLLHYPAPNEIKEIKRDQAAARYCAATLLKS